MVNSLIQLPEPIELTLKVQIFRVQYFEKHGKKRRLCSMCMKQLSHGQAWIQAEYDIHWKHWKPICMECAHEHGILFELRKQGVIW